MKKQEIKRAFICCVVSLGLSAVLANSGDSQKCLTLETSNAKVVIALHGGRILSFKVRGHEVLWRPRAWRLDGKDWYHGGMPLCWPWFGRGDGNSMLHGFARDSVFSVRSKKMGAERCELVLGLASDAETIKLWPHEFDLEYRIVLTDRLRLSLKTTNTGSRPFLLTAGLHPYFAVKDRDRTIVTGTDGMKFCDSRKTTEFNGVWHGDMPMDKSCDHVFVEPRATAYHALVDPMSRRRIAIASSGAARLVVWNPGTEDEVASEKPAPGELAIDDWRRFVCVEPAILWRDAACTVDVGASHLLTTEIYIEPEGRCPGRYRLDCREILSFWRNMVYFTPSKEEVGDDASQ